MILLDTSAWIEFFKKNSNFKLNLLYKPSEIYLCLPVYQEILQGIGDDNIYLQIKKALDLGEGELIGIKKGLEKGKSETAKKMKAEGKGITFILKVTGLSEEQIKDAGVL
jgi:predicted transposase/invertase (TIGR01784 family)